MPRLAQDLFFILMLIILLRCEADFLYITLSFVQTGLSIIQEL